MSASGHKRSHTPFIARDRFYSESGRGSETRHAGGAGADGSVVVGKILETADYNYGFDAQDIAYKDLLKAGIIDPTKVVRCALQDAASIAALLITTEAMVAEKPEKKAPMAGPPGGDMGGMGGMDF